MYENIDLKMFKGSTKSLNFLNKTAEIFCERFFVLNFLFQTIDNIKHKN